MSSNPNFKIQCLTEYLGVQFIFQTSNLSNPIINLWTKQQSEIAHRSLLDELQQVIRLSKVKQHSLLKRIKNSLDDSQRCTDSTFSSAASIRTDSMNSAAAGYLPANRSKPLAPSKRRREHCIRTFHCSLPL